MICRINIINVFQLELLTKEKKEGNLCLVNWLQKRLDILPKKINLSSRQLLCKRRLNQVYY